MPTIGHIGEFNPEIENFKSYETRIRQYFVANDIAAAKQVPAFISTIGVKGYKTLQDILAPADPCAAQLNALCDALRNHFSPKPLQLAERFRLHKCVQGNQQSVTDYIASLKSLSMNCGYAAAVLDETLRDIFIVGLRNSNIQKELLAKPDTLSFKQACDAAIQLETATKEVSQLTNTRSTAVNAIGA